jgi:hypothetical protein
MKTKENKIKKRFQTGRHKELVRKGKGGEGEDS